MWTKSYYSIRYKQWNKNEFTMMERRLNRIIPLIRFYNMPSEEFLLKVHPFKDLLPKDLLNNIFAYHMAPNYLYIISSKFKI